MARLTKEELWQYMGIKKSTWQHKRKECIEIFELYGGWIEKDIKDKRKEVFVIEHPECLPKINSFKKRQEERKIVLIPLIERVLSNDNLQTAANIYRLIQDDLSDELKSLSEKTVQKLISKILKEEYGTIFEFPEESNSKGFVAGKIWTKLNYDECVYIRMSDEEYSYWKICLQECLYKKHYEILNDNIAEVTQANSPEEFQRASIRLAKAAKSGYYCAMGAFFRKFSMYPVKTNIYKDGKPTPEELKIIEEYRAEHDPAMNQNQEGVDFEAIALIAKQGTFEFP